ncbi:MAG: chaperone NapD [Thermodesulfobacteriota bacterium]|nr:chaperone NapD [Thermodesulfobacteriota bacterium]
MAILGFLIHTLDEDVQGVEAKVNEMPEITTYGIHQDHFIVTVAEVAADDVEKTMNKIKELDGVLTTYTTYLTIEDEIDENGNLETNLSLTDLMKKEPKDPIN